MTAGRGRSAAALVLAVLFLAALAVRAVVALQLAGHPLLQPTGGLDTEAYVALAARVVGGDWILGPAAYFVSPLYVYVLAAALGLTQSLTAARLVQALFGAVAVVLAADVARRQHGLGAALAAGGLLAACGVVAFNEALVLQSALDPFLTALALWTLWRALETRRAAWFGLAGLALGLHVLNRPNVLAWAVVLAILLVLRRDHRRHALPLALGLAVALAPVAVRNRVVSGEWILVTSHGGLNFYIGNNARADGTYRAVPGITPNIAGQAVDARKVAAQAAGRPLTDGEVSAHFYRDAWAWIRAEPVRAARLLMRKVAYVLNATDISLNASYAYYREDEPTLLRFLPVGPGLLVPLGLVGLVMIGRGGGVADRWARWTWAAFVPIYTLSVAAFFVSGRYRLPLLVPLAVGGGLAIAGLWADLRAGNRARAAAAAAGVALLALLANADLGLDDGRANERTEMIVHLVDAGRWAEARPLFDRAAAGHPDPDGLRSRVAEALADQGKAALAAGAADRARALLADAVAVRDDAETRAVLGAALVLLERTDEAARHLEEALRQDQSNATAHLNLAVVRAQQGRDDEARRHAREALRLRPGDPRASGLLEALSH